MGTLLYICDLRGHPRLSPQTPWGSMDPRLRTYDLDQGFSTAGTRPSTGTWRLSYRDLECLGKLIIDQIHHL